MELKTAYETAPSDDDLLWSIEHWDTDKIESRESMHSSSEIEAFVHPDTATGARIMAQDDGAYSVQTSTGDYDNGDCVVQSDDPTELLGGGCSVLALDVETVSEARVIAYTWMKGWVMRNSSLKGDRRPGDVLDAEGKPQYSAIE